jgi:hypothetical protein
LNEILALALELAWQPPFEEDWKIHFAGITSTRTIFATQNGR